MNPNFMKEAIKKAKFSGKDIPVGAVIVKNGEIIAKATNQRELRQNTIYHAEMVAIKRACRKLRNWRLNDCEIYVTLEPCVMCAGALGWSQLGRLVWGADDAKRGFSRFAPEALHPKTEIAKGVMAKECAEIIQEFFKNKR